MHLVYTHEAHEVACKAFSTWMSHAGSIWKFSFYLSPFTRAAHKAHFIFQLIPRIKGTKSYDLLFFGPKIITSFLCFHAFYLAHISLFFFSTFVTFLFYTEKEKTKKRRLPSTHATLSPKLSTLFNRFYLFISFN